MTSETVEQLSKKNLQEDYVVRLKTHETIDQISRLFVQLRLPLGNTTEISDISSIFEQLTNICHRLLDRKCYSTEEVFLIFEKLLKYYFLLLDSEEFVDHILEKYSSANNDFIRAFYHSIKFENAIFQVGSTTTYKARLNLFFHLLDLISSSTRILAFLQSESVHELPRLVNTTCRILLIKLFSIFNSTNIISLELSVIKLKKYEKVLFNRLIVFLDKHFTDNSPSENDLLIQQILCFLYVISKEISIIPILINIECPSACLRWLTLPYLKVEEYKYVILILKNIARHDDGIIILHQHDCVKLFEQFTNKILYTKIDYIIHPTAFDEQLFIQYMIFFSIINPNTVDSKEHWDIIDNSLLPTVKNAFFRHTWICGDFSISEFLIILMKLFNNDGILNYILQKPLILEFFYEALKTCCRDIDRTPFRIQYADEILLSIIVLANIFWSISFQDQCKKDLTTNFHFLTRCESYVSSTVSSTSFSRQIFPFKRAIDGIRQNLFPLKPATISPTRSLMISYSSFDVDSYRKLHQLLVKNSNIFSISPDADHWKQIAQNIEQAEFVLFLISNHFLVNKSCRQELIYARDILNKSCILVYIDRDFPAIDWVTQSLDRLQSIDIHQNERLLSMINETLSTEENHLSNVKQWNDREVQQWFTNHHLLPELHEFYRFENGNELFLYAQAILAYPWTKEYERIRLRFERKFDEQEKTLSPHEFLKFIRALERLRHTSS